MPRIGPMELVLILVVVLLIFGPGRLPEVGGAIGRGIREFRKSVGGDEASARAEERGEEEKTPDT